MPNKNLKDHCDWNNQGWMYRDKAFSRACCSKTRSDGCKLKEGWPKLDIGKKIFTVRVIHWDTGTDFPEGVGSIPGNRQDFNLMYLKLSLLMNWVTFRSPFPSNPNHSMIQKNPFASPLFSPSLCWPHICAVAGCWSCCLQSSFTSWSMCSSSCRDCTAPSHVFRKLCLPLEGVWLKLLGEQPGIDTEWGILFCLCFGQCLSPRNIAALPRLQDVYLN